MIRKCCVCHRIERKGEWLAGCILAGHEPLTHGYCPDCFIEVTEKNKKLYEITERQMLRTPFRSNAKGRQN